MSSKEGIKTLADSYGKHEQHLDVLVNNAGTGKELPIKADKDDAEKLQESLWSEEQCVLSPSFFPLFKLAHLFLGCYRHCALVGTPGPKCST